MFTGINAIEFNRRFFDDHCCYQYLMEKKWGNGYSCPRCGCTQHVKGRTRYYRRCKGCKYDESVTANTVFHGMKMPLLKAFHLIFRLTAKKKGMSTIELAAEVGVEQKTAWLFKRKLQEIMKDNDKLDGAVDADETLIGGHCKGIPNRGRSLNNKTALAIATERLADGRTGNINFTIVENFKAMTLKYALQDMIAPTATIRTDQHPSYESLKDQLPISTVASEKGSSLQEIHIQIMLFKNWLRGIHHKCSTKLLFAYTNEYKYRFNKRNKRKWIFDDMIRRLMHNPPHPFPVLKTLCAYST